MKLGELVHQMILNYEKLNPNHNACHDQYFMQNDKYMNAHDALNKLGDGNEELVQKLIQTQGN